jgi:hypothetical protein
MQLDLAAMMVSFMFLLPATQVSVARTTSTEDRIDGHASSDTAVRVLWVFPRLVLSFILASLICTPVFAQRPDFGASDLRSKEIVKRLFNAQSFDTNGAAMWKPNFADSMEFEGNVWSDGSCHTKLDTIMAYRISDSVRGAIMVFSTISEEGCMYCYPDISVAFAEFWISRNNVTWTIDRFKKSLGRFGGFGDENGPLVALRKAGPQTWLLQLTTRVGTNPESIDNTHFFDDYDEVLAITIHHEDGAPTYSWDRQLSFVVPKDQSDLSSTDCYDIIAVQTGTLPVDPSDVKSAAKKFSRKERYEYNFGLHRYERAK